MSRWRLWSRRPSTGREPRIPEWADAPLWVVKHAAREGWGEREWSQWEEICERFEHWGIELAPDGAGGRLAIHASSLDGSWVSGEFIEPADAKPLNAALIRLVRQAGNRVHRRAA